MTAKGQIGPIIAHLQRAVAEGRDAELDEVRRLPGGLHHHVFATELAGEPVVLKVYSRPRRGEAEREWRTLGLLEPLDVAPYPISFHDHPLFPTVAMSYLPGSAKDPSELREDELLSIFETHRKIQRLGVPGGVEDAINHPTNGLTRTRRYLDVYLASARELFGNAPSLEDAWNLAREWVARLEVEDLVGSQRAVLCRGDVNLVNYLWSGTEVKLIDFEDAGLNHPSFELADMAEHPNSRQVPGMRWEKVMETFGLDPEAVWAGRRLLAVFWMTILAGKPRARDLNPPGALEEAACRVNAYLG